ncbi:MAG: PD-(D/E)XK nuclease family protein [Candidatus Aenigmarchaeota archaeon]|nr:PD-(D/E)XK nuclease family protein [Candidatus Aenigmarchaeota archaeon]
MIKLSNSTLGIFRECHLCFWLKFTKGVERPEGIMPSLPNGMDRILKAHFDSFRGKELPPEIGHLEGMKLFDDAKTLEAWRNRFRGIEYEDKEKDAILKGVLDEVLVSNGKLVAFDFKTRGFPLKENSHSYYQDQLNIYTFLLQRNGFETEDYGYLLFYYPDRAVGKGVTVFGTSLVKVPVNPEDAEKLFHDAVDCLNNGRPEPAAGCGYCRYAVQRNP